MKNPNSIIVLKFTVLCLFVLGANYFGHKEILQSKFNISESESLFRAYLFNGVFTITVFTTLLILRKKHMDSLGFFFLGGSLLKFILFFIFFFPVYKTNGGIDTIEFAEFFIPYGLCLFLEVFVLVKVLMKED